MDSPVRIHGLGRTGHTCLKHIFAWAAYPVKVFVIQKYDLGEKHRFFVSRTSLAGPWTFNREMDAIFSNRPVPKSQGHSNKGIVSSGRTYSIQLIFNSLPSLIKLSSDFIQSIFNGTFLASAPVLI